MYSLLVDDNSNSLINASNKNIVQYSDLIDTFQFLVQEKYEDIEMKDFKVYLEYKLPDKLRFETKELTLLIDEDNNPVLYKGHLQYLLPISGEFTEFVGNIEMRLLFVKE